jgi:hypothetical protein
MSALENRMHDDFKEFFKVLAEPDKRIQRLEDRDK